MSENEDRFRFRVWDTEKKELIYNAENAYDYMRPCSGGKIIEADCFGDVLANKRYIVEQSTGLKDKNGRLIYENDVVKITGDVMTIPIFYEESKAFVKWDEDGFFLHFESGKIERLFQECWEYEVVGNIHENPELLEVHNGN